MAEKDLYQGDGNSTVASSIPTKIINKAGQTDPGLRDAGKLLDTTKSVQKGWSK